jgi:hypothetical protein
MGDSNFYRAYTIFCFLINAMIDNLIRDIRALYSAIF